MTNKVIWDAIKQPPKTALKVIMAGRLRGKSDINPQWRYEAMTDVFGPCGTGWKYTIDKVWNEPATDGQVFAFALVSIFYAVNDGAGWSDPIQGMGGSMLVTKEKEGLHSSDEGYKMAITDAIGTAMKMIGMAADIYAGKWDGSKYAQTAKEPLPKVDGMGEPLDVPDVVDTGAIYKTIEEKSMEYNLDFPLLCKFLVLKGKMPGPEIESMDIENAHLMLEKWNKVVESYHKWYAKEYGVKAA